MPLQKKRIAQLSHHDFRCKTVLRRQLPGTVWNWVPENATNGTANFNKRSYDVNFERVVTGQDTVAWRMCVSTPRPSVASVTHAAKPLRSIAVWENP